MRHALAVMQTIFYQIAAKLGLYERNMTKKGAFCMLFADQLCKVNTTQIIVKNLY